MSARCEKDIDMIRCRDISLELGMYLGAKPRVANFDNPRTSITLDVRKLALRHEELVLYFREAGLALRYVFLRDF